MSHRVSACLASALLLGFGVAASAQTKPAAQATPAKPAAAPAAAADKKSEDDKAAPADAAAKPAADASASRPGVASVATGWAVGCATQPDPGKLRCEVTNAVVLSPGNQRFVSVAVRRDATTSEEVMVLSLPHGVLFTAGVVAEIDGKETGKFEPVTSDQMGAYAKLPLAGATIPSLETGKTLTVVFSGTGGQKFTVGMPLAGFAAAHGKMKAEN